MRGRVGEVAGSGEVGVVVVVGDWSNADCGDVAAAHVEGGGNAVLADGGDD